MPHHIMMDCVLEEYLKRHPNTEYPVHPLVPDGHKANDYIRTFFPLYTNQELLPKSAEKFGYYCSLPNVGTTNPEGKNIFLQINIKSEYYFAIKGSNSFFKFSLFPLACIVSRHCIITLILTATTAKLGFRQ